VEGVMLEALQEVDYDVNDLAFTIWEKGILIEV
jgi:hypothetical protein